jgi:hypothetical protein
MRQVRDRSNSLGGPPTPYRCLGRTDHRHSDALPTTHEAYLEQYGDDVTELGVWNTEGRNTIAVNADAPIDWLEELAENADLFDNKIVGTDPGAGPVVVGGLPRRHRDGTGPDERRMTSSGGRTGSIGMRPWPRRARRVTTALRPWASKSFLTVVSGGSK